MSTASFKIVYDGPALASHEMEVRDLAPALLAIGDLFDEANEILNHGKSKVAVNVKGSFKTGCFGIDLTVVQSLLQQAQHILLGDPVTAAVQLITLLGMAAGGIKGLLQLIKWVRNRKITKVEILGNNIVKIYCDDDHFETEEAVLNLFRNWKLRKSFQDVIYTPLQKEGIDSFAVQDQEGEFTVITKEESVFFVSPDLEAETIEESEREISLQLVNVAFRDDNKWRFFDGASTFYGSVVDEPFLRRVESNEELFGKGDILKVKLREKRNLVGEQLKTEYEIVEVLEHRRTGLQLNLPISRMDTYNKNS